MSGYRTGLLSCLAVGLALANTACTPTDEPTALLRQLQAGDLILYMRHAATEDMTETRRGAYDDCSWQRNLSRAGREQASAVAAALPSLKLPIDTVIASPTCRTMDTARIAFGSARPEPALRGGRKPNGEIDVAPITALWARVPPKGRLTIIVGHESPELGFRPALAMGESAVIRPNGSGSEVIGRIPPQQWERWRRPG